MLLSVCDGFGYLNVRVTDCLLFIIFTNYYSILIISLIKYY